MPNFLIEAKTDNNGLVISQTDPLLKDRKSKFSNSLNESSDEDGNELPVKKQQNQIRDSGPLLNAPFRFSENE